MAQSAEYPDLLWMPPRSWTNANRTSVQLVVIHTTEGSAHGSSAEDGAHYNQTRTDGTSAHYFHDSNSTVHCVKTADIAHTARRQGNLRGIHHELCGRAGWSAETWENEYCTAMLRLAAKQAARDAAKWNIPIRWLTPEQVRSGVKGFCGHVDITYAFPEDNGDHTDPGKNFPKEKFLALVRGEEEEDVEAQDVWQYTFSSPAFGVSNRAAVDWMKVASEGNKLLINSVSAKVDALATALAKGDQALQAKLAEIDSEAEAARSAEATRDQAQDTAIADNPQATVDLLLSQAGGSEALVNVLKNGMSEEQFAQFKNAVAAA